MDKYIEYQGALMMLSIAAKLLYINNNKKVPDYIIKNRKLLQELVNQTKPVRLKTEINEHNATDYRCPKCNNVVQSYDNYCSKCSQRLVAFNKE